MGFDDLFKVLRGGHHGHHKGSHHNVYYERDHGYYRDSSQSYPPEKYREDIPGKLSCPKCFTIVHSNFRFCPGCGTDLQWPSTPAARFPLLWGV